MQKEQLIAELMKSQNLQCRIEQSLQNAPIGSLIGGFVRGKYPQYYIVEKKEGDRYSHRRFLRKSEIYLAKQLAQKEYDQKVLALLIQKNKAIQHFLTTYPDQSMIDIYDNIPESKKKLVQPYYLPDNEYLEDWYNQHTGMQNGFPIENGFLTENGEYVRSKSEKMLADKLFYKRIPYVYEAQLRLERFGSIFPDFTVLNTRTRKTYYWEHFGMMDDPAYCKKALDKLDIYEKSDINQGESLIVTMECSQRGIQMQQVDRIINRFLI